MQYPIFPTTRKAAEKAGDTYSSQENRNSQFPTRLRRLREKASISQKALADRLGISKSTLGLWETGDTLPDAKMVSELADFFGVSSDYLLCRTKTAAINFDIRAICDYTGLDEYAVNNLISNLSNDKCTMDILNYIIRSDLLLSSLVIYYLSAFASLVKESPFDLIPLSHFSQLIDRRLAYADILDVLPRDRNIFFESMKKDTTLVKSCVFGLIMRSIGEGDIDNLIGQLYKNRNIDEKNDQLSIIAELVSASSYGREKAGQLELDLNQFINRRRKNNATQK